MNIVAQLKTIQQGLAGFSARYNAPISLAHDQSHLVQILTVNPGAPRIGLLVLEEDPRNDTYSDVVGLQDRKFWICLSRGYTLEAFPGKSLTDGYAGGKPLYELLDALVIPVRALRFDDPEPMPYYKGFKQLTIEGAKLDAYALTLVIASDRGNEPIDTTVSNED